MVAPRAFTGSLRAIHSAALQALHSTEGVELLFEVTDYGSLEATAIASRAAQQAFSSLRAKSRRKVERKMTSYHTELGQGGIARDTDAEGQFDTLHCTRLPMPDEQGWIVSIAPASLSASFLKVRDIASGEILNGPTLSERDKIADAVSHALIHDRSKLTPQLWDDYDALHPGALDNMNVPRPGGARRGVEQPSAPEGDGTITEALVEEMKGNLFG